MQFLLLVSIFLIRDEYLPILDDHFNVIIKMRSNVVGLFLIVLCTFDVKLTLQSESRRIYEISKHRVDEVRERIGDLFWNHVKTNDLQKLQISPQCHQNLKSVTLKVNEKWGKQSK